MTHLRIGDVSRKLSISVDTLRYYEKIDLLSRVGRLPSGIRVYDERDLSRIRFIQRAQKMNFSLAEIAGLLQMREDPRNARTGVRELTQEKLALINQNLRDLTILREELSQLLCLCAESAEGCPIIQGIEDAKSSGAVSRKRNNKYA